MSLAFKSEAPQEYATKTEIHYMFRVTMFAITKAIREEKLAIHLIDGKVQINIAEAKDVFGKTKTDLFK